MKAGELKNFLSAVPDNTVVFFTVPEKKALDIAKAMLYIYGTRKGKKDFMELDLGVCKAVINYENFLQGDDCPYIEFEIVPLMSEGVMDEILKECDNSCEITIKTKAE